MKKIIILICSISLLGNLMAQNYSQSFNDVFQYVNLKFL